MKKEDELDYSMFEDDSNITDDGLDYSMFDEPNISKTESFGRGSLQGLTVGTSDELGAGALTGYESLRRFFNRLVGDSPEDQLAEEVKKIEERRQYKSDKPIKTEDFSKELEEGNLGDMYRDLRDTTREANKAAQEANTGTYLAGELIGGIAPALFTGGASATAAVGKELTKQGLKQAGKSGLGAASWQAAKEGFKFGAGAGAGYSEADLTKGEIVDFGKDTLVGGLIGGGLGAATPIAVKGAKEGTKYAGKKAKELLEFLVPGQEYVKAGYKYGKMGRKITAENLHKDVTNEAQNIVLRAENEMQKNSTLGVAKYLDDLGITVNTEDDIRKTIESLKKIAADDVLNVDDQKILNTLVNATPEGQQALFADTVKRKLMIKKIKAKGKEKKALIKAEKDIAKMQETGNYDITQVDEIAKMVDDISDDVITKEGMLVGKQATFEPSGEGEAFTKKFLSDTTEFQPVTKMGQTPEGRLVAEILDEGSGNIDVVVGKLMNNKDLSKLNYSELNGLQAGLTKLIKEASNPKSPAVVEAKKLVKKIAADKDALIVKSGNKDLIGKRARQSDIMAGQEKLGIRKKNQPLREDLRFNEQVRNVGSMIGKTQGYKQESKLLEAKDLLGKKVFTKNTEDKIKMFRDLDQVVNREAQETATLGSMYRSLSARLPNVAGRATRKIEKTLSPVEKTVEKVSLLGKERMGLMADDLINSQNKGIQFLGTQLKKASQVDDLARNQILWQLSQTNAFREVIRQKLPDFDEKAVEFLNNNSLISPAEAADYMPPVVSPDENISEYYQGIDNSFMTELEGYKTEGYIPDSENLPLETLNQIRDLIDNNKVAELKELTGRTPQEAESKYFDSEGNPRQKIVRGQSGVTIANALDLGQRTNLDDLDLDEEIKQELEHYLGLKFGEAQDKLNERPLNLDDDQTKKVAKATQDAYYKAVKNNFNKYKAEGGKNFEDLPKAVQTILFSKQFHTGKIGLSNIKEASKGNYKKVYENFINDNSKNKDRRKKEGKYLKEKIKPLIESRDFYENMEESNLNRSPASIEQGLNPSFNVMDKLYSGQQSEQMTSPSTSPVMDAKSKLDALLKGYADQQPIPAPQRQPQELKSQLDSLIKEGTELSKTAMDRMMDGVDRITRMISSGDSTPVDQIDDLVGQVDDLQISDEDKEMLVDQIFEIQSVADAQRVKDMLRGLMNETGTIDN